MADNGMAGVYVTLSQEHDWKRDAMTETTEPEVESEPKWVQRWDVCDECGASTLIAHHDGQPLPDTEEWDRLQCLVCGNWGLRFGNAEEETTEERLASIQRDLITLLAERDKLMSGVGNVDRVTYMGIKEFWEKGFLQEANRIFFHPLGLALEVTGEPGSDGEETWRISGVWDYRADPEGMLFGPGEMSYTKMVRVEEERQRHIPARSAEADTGHEKTIYYLQSPVPDVPSTETRA